MITSAVLTAAVQPALKFVLNFAGGMFKNQKTDSLISFTKATRVEPIALVDQRLAHQPFMNDVMQSISSMFIGYYLQAISLAVNVGRVNVVKLLDALNPTRDVHDAAATRIVAELNGPNKGLLSMESYRYALPAPGEAVGMEAFGEMNHDEWIDKSLKEGMKAQKIKDEIEKSNLNKNQLLDNVSIHGKSELQKAVSEAVNLSVGKLVEVTIEDDGKKATFPIMIRVISTIVSPNTLVHILADGSRFFASAKERFHSWRAGQLEFIRDLVLCQDLIDEHRKALLQDKSGVYQEILARRTGNSTASFLSGSPSIGTASNILVIAASTAKQVEAEIGGRLSSKAVRDRMFDKTYIMIMVIVDPETEQVVFYHRGIAQPTELSIKELKVANKGTGPDVGEILKAYQLGNNPTYG